MTLKRTSQRLIITLHKNIKEINKYRYIYIITKTKFLEGGLKLYYIILLWW